MAEEKKTHAAPESPDQVADEQLDDASGGGRTFEPLRIVKQVDKAGATIDDEQDTPSDFKQSS